MSIPKIIHYCWFGGGAISPENRKCMKSWKKYCPDYKIIEWNEQNFDIGTNRYAQQAYEAKKYAFVSDYARLAVVYEHGGIYLDTDVELVRPLDELLELPGFMGFQNNNEVATGLGFGARKGNPVVQALLRDYDALGFFKGRRQRGPDALPGTEYKGIAGAGRAQRRHKAEHRGNGDLSGRVFLPDGVSHPGTPGNTQDLLHPPLCRKLEAEAQRGQPRFAAAAEEALLYMVLPSAQPGRETAEKEALKTGAAARCCVAVLFVSACPFCAGMLYFSDKGQCAVRKVFQR